MKRFTAPLLRTLLALLLACVASSAAWAHKGSDAYLQITDQPALGLRYAVAIKDLALVVNMDGNGDGQVTWGEIQAATPTITSLVSSALSLADAPALQWQFDGLEARGDGAYVRLKASPANRVGTALALRYTLFQTQDASHRLLVAGQLDGHDLLLTLSPTQTQPTPLRAASAGTADATTGLAPASATAQGRQTASPNSAWQSLRQYFLLGVHHLLEGYDHLAFLLALVLPLHLRLWPRRAGAASAFTAAPARPQGSEWGSLLRTITAFTLGHSITLALATLGYTSADAAWVEPAIALSIGVSAWLNLYPQAWLRTEVLAGAFGLVHGYGFAGLLTEAAAPSGLLGWALGGFNLGVEAGQLLAVTAWLIVSQPLVGGARYDRWVVRGGSGLLLLLSAYWFVQRVL